MSGMWKLKFSTKDTSDGDFLSKGSVPTKVKMMVLKDKKWNYVKDEALDAEILELPYIGDELSMYIILPTEKTGLDKLKSTLTLENLNQAISGMHTTSIDIFMPKFKVEHKYSLVSPFQELGLKKIFSTGADLSGINGQKNLFVSEVVHKAVIEVNEEGTEAAAATGIQIPPGYPLELRVDHPFIFLIKDKRDGMISFIGVINSI